MSKALHMCGNTKYTLVHLCGMILLGFMQPKGITTHSRNGWNVGIFGVYFVLFLSLFLCYLNNIDDCFEMWLHPRRFVEKRWEKVRRYKRKREVLSKREKEKKKRSSRRERKKNWLRAENWILSLKYAVCINVESLFFCCNALISVCAVGWIAYSYYCC